MPRRSGAKFMAVLGPEETAGRWLPKVEILLFRKMETYATTLSKYNTAEAALEKNQPKFSQVPYTDAQATMINREVERTELAQSSAIHGAEHSTGLLGGGWGWNLAPGVAHAPRARGCRAATTCCCSSCSPSTCSRRTSAWRRASPARTRRSTRRAWCTAQTAYSPVAGLAFAPSLERGGAAAAAAAGASSGAAAAGGGPRCGRERRRRAQPRPAARAQPDAAAAAGRADAARRAAEPLPGLPPADLERSSIDEGVPPAARREEAARRRRGCSPSSRRRRRAPAAAARRWRCRA